MITTVNEHCPEAHEQAQPTLLAVPCVSAPPQGNSSVCTSRSLAARHFRGTIRAFVCFIGEKVETLLAESLIQLVSQSFEESTRIACVLGFNKCPQEQSHHFQTARLLSEIQGDRAYLPPTSLIHFRCQNLRQDQASTTRTGS